MRLGAVHHPDRELVKAGEAQVKPRFAQLADFEREHPDDPNLAIAAGRRLCGELLEPLQAAFGRLAIRSAYRAPAVNAFGNAHGLSCASNERN